MRKILLLLTLTFFSFPFEAQLVVNNSLTPQQLVNNILVGTGVQVSNITYNGDPVSIGAFDGSNSNIGFQGGIILKTGDIATAVGPNDDGGSGEDLGEVGDPDIDIIVSPNGSNDASVLEFDFIPVSDTIKFNYVFASEEYLEWVNAGFNDAFGFFISGPGITGPFSNNSKNIAIIPGSSLPVSIDNVNDNSFSQFYFDNETPAGQTVQFDGFTTPLQAISEVQCGQIYHLKMVVADAGDGAFDSGVFLEAGSLSSTDIDFKFASVDGDTVFYENCTEAEFIFTRPADQTAVALTINIAISGTATPLADYSTIPNSITFNIGVDTVFVPFQTFTDNLDESSETVSITADVITECGDTIQITKSISINDPIRIDSISTIPTLSCINSGSAQVFTSNSAGTINYSWNGPGSSGPIVATSPSITNSWSGWYYITVDDDFCETKDSIFIDELPAPIAAFSVGNTVGAAPLVITFTNESQNAESFDWIFGNGLNTTVNDLSNQSSLYPENISYTVTLIAYQQTCSDTMIFKFELISQPSVHEPNIFTPNGDTINANFTLNPINFATFDYSIFNRWGNLMFQGNLTSSNWNGMIEDKEAEEAVYFYKFSGVGINGESKTGQGFFHLKK